VAASKPVSQTRSGSFVEWSDVLVVTVNLRTGKCRLNIDRGRSALGGQRHARPVTSNAGSRGPGMWLILQSDKGISSVRLAEEVGVSQPTAWRMGHALRLLATREQPLGGTVEFNWDACPLLVEFSSLV
jgi:hypothetical protein